MSLELRAPRIEEAPALRELIDRYSLAVLGESDLSEEEVRHWFEVPRIWMQVAERDGKLVGYLDVAPNDDVFNADIRTTDREAAEAFLAAAEERARGTAGASALRGHALGGDQMLTEVLMAAGFGPVRHAFQMRIELTDDIPEPVWSDGLFLRNYRDGEVDRVYEAVKDAFQGHWGFHPEPLEDWRVLTVEHPSFDPSLWWLVEDGDEIAALTLNRWYLSGDPEFGWVDVLGVRERWRRRGLATSLLQHSFRDFLARGATRVGLGVDTANPTGAVQLYERVGMTVARRNDTYEKAL